MRELLFRAWYEKTKEFLYFDIKEGHVGSEPIMQFTGLKDKNGKEIYEGDIVFAATEHRQEKWIIEYHDDFMGFRLCLETSLGNKYSISIDDVNHEARDVEVIGNIYEGEHNNAKGD